MIGTELAKDLAATFLNARFTAEDRRQRRLAKVINLEKKYATAAKAPEMNQ